MGLRVYPTLKPTAGGSGGRGMSRGCWEGGRPRGSERGRFGNNEYSMVRYILVERRQFHSVGLSEMCQTTRPAGISWELIHRFAGFFPTDRALRGQEQMTVLADELCPWPRGLLHPGQHNLVGADDFWYPRIPGTGRVRERYALAVVRMQHLHVVGITHSPLLCKHLSAGAGCRTSRS
jgi:hypothetical protein